MKVQAEGKDVDVKGAIEEDVEGIDENTTEDDIREVIDIVMDESTDVSDRTTTQPLGMWPPEAVFPSIVANKLNGINRITVIVHDSFTGGGQFANPMDVSILSVNGQVATARGRETCHMTHWWESNGWTKERRECNYTLYFNSVYLRARAETVGICKSNSKYSK